LVSFLLRFVLDSIANDRCDDQQHLGCGVHVVTCRDVALVTDREQHSEHSEHLALALHSVGPHGLQIALPVLAGPAFLAIQSCHEEKLTN
jgi:hypothetical protein